MENVNEALASTARRKILAYLSEGELSAGEIAERFDFSKPALSGHLRILEQAGLIEREKRGQFVYFRLVRDRLGEHRVRVVSNLLPRRRPDQARTPRPQARRAQTLSDLRLATFTSTLSLRRGMRPRWPRRRLWKVSNRAAARRRRRPAGRGR